MTRNELLSSPGYWEEKIHSDLYDHIQAYLQKEGISRSDLAQRLGVTKGYVTQIMNGITDHKVSKLVDLALFMGFVPLIQYRPLKQVLFDDETGACHPHNQPNKVTRTIAMGYWGDLSSIDEMDSKFRTTIRVSTQSKDRSYQFAGN